jgi:sigma-B regulation protein RsbU (phosphoserine phosphatase)
VAHGVGEIRVNLGDGLVGACVARSEAVLVNDTSNDERFLNRIDHSSGYVTNSALVIPLRVQGGKVIGAFQALNKPGGFTESDVALLGVAGSYSAAAIETQRLRKEAETARLLMRELEIARDVQTALLPQQLPTIPGLDCAAFFRPAKVIGGDYYDFTETPEEVLAFTLGDVAGKGVAAAVLMASIQASLRLSLHNGTDSVASLVASVNQSVYASSSAGRYSTLFCGLLNPATRRLTYVNAGQCSPLLIHRHEAGVGIKRLSLGGTPVGLLPEAVYDEGAVLLQPGDTLVCFSDGISEASNLRDEFWPEEDMERLLCANAGSTAREITDAIVRAADDFAGEAEQADDMTIVTLRVVC